MMGGNRWCPGRPGQGGVLTFSTLAPSLISFNVPLRHPDRPGKSIRRLRGVVPVMVSARAPEPLIIPLKDAVGRKVEGRGATLEIRELRDAPGRPWEMKLFIRTEDPREDTGFPSSWLQNSQLELVGVQGQPTRALFSFAYVEKDLKAATLRLMDGERAQAPVELRSAGLKNVGFQWFAGIDSSSGSRFVCEESFHSGKSYWRKYGERE